MRYGRLKTFEKFGKRETELFEDLLQEYFDKWKIYPESEWHQFVDTSNGNFSIKEVSSTYFKVDGFPDHRKGILIKISAYKDILKSRESMIEFEKDLEKFINRIDKMGYYAETSHSSYHRHKNYYIAIPDADQEDDSWTVESVDPIKYLNKNFEVSEDEISDFAIRITIDVDGFNGRERSQIEDWNRSIGSPYASPTFYTKSIVGIGCNSLSINIEKWEDEWYTLTCRDRDDGDTYYIFDNWEDLKDRVNKILYEFLNYYTPEEEKKRREWLEEMDQMDESIVSDELVSELNWDQYMDFWNTHSSIELSEKESDKINNMFLKTWDESEIDRPKLSGNGKTIYNTWWTEDGYEIYVYKFEDDWFLVEFKIAESWNPIKKYFLCDEIESIGLIDFNEY